MTQRRPRGPEQKDFNVLISCFRRRPDTDLSARLDLEICNVFYPDKRTFGRVLKYKSACTFRYRGMASRDLNRDVEILSIVPERWHASERDLGMRVPATEHVRVDGPFTQVRLGRQWIVCPSETSVVKSLSP